MVKNTFSWAVQRKKKKKCSECKKRVWRREVYSPYPSGWDFGCWVRLCEVCDNTYFHLRVLRW